MPKIDGQDRGQQTRQRVFAIVMIVSSFVGERLIERPARVDVVLRRVAERARDLGSIGRERAVSGLAVA
jgi:hypothetical protein